MSDKAHLITALEQNDVDEMRYYVEQHGDINCELEFKDYSDKMTPLQFATKKGMIKMLSELLASGSNVNQVNKMSSITSCTALQMACNLSNEETSLHMVNVLLSYRGNVNQLDNCGRSPLLKASERGHSRVVEVLLEHGAEVNPSLHDAFSSLDVCHSLNSITQSHKLMQEFCDPFLHNTPLIQASREHHIHVVNILLDHGADVDGVNDAKNTALHVACFSYCYDINSDRGKGAWFREAGHAGIVKRLVEGGGDMNKLNRFHEAPVDLAISGISKVNNWDYPPEQKLKETTILLDIIQFLVLSGCQVDWYRDIVHEKQQQDSSLMTRFLCACKVVTEYDSQTLQNDFHRVMELLLAAGAPVSQDNIQNLTELKLFPDLLATATRLQQMPHSLKRLCKLLIRQFVCKPLPRHLPTTGIPQFLQSYILLQNFDAIYT